jgi:hypothetical protein
MKGNLHPPCPCLTGRQAPSKGGKIKKGWKQTAVAIPLKEYETYLI